LISLKGNKIQGSYRKTKNQESRKTKAIQSRRKTKKPKSPKNQPEHRTYNIKEPLSSGFFICPITKANLAVGRLFILSSLYPSSHIIIFYQFCNITLSTFVKAINQPNMSMYPKRQTLMVMVCGLLFLLFTFFAIGKPVAQSTCTATPDPTPEVQSIGTDMIWESLSRQFIQVPY
jgi:hypothetical protein